MSTVDISIIIPIYNVEKYLDRCINSVIEQSFEKWELLLINDKSSDGSLLIAENYSEKDERIKVFTNHENSGVSFSRNVGLYEAIGDYIVFIDSDDYLSTKESLKTIHSLSKENNLDILDCSYGIKNEISSTPKSTHNRGEGVIGNQTYSGNQYLNHIQIFSSVIWNKIYKRQFIKDNNLVFPIRKYEDVSFSLNAVLLAKRVRFFDFPFYTYCIRENSIMTSLPTRQSLKDALDLCYDLEIIYKKNKRISQVRKIFFYSFIGFVRLMKIYCDIDKKNFEKNISILHRKYRIDILKTKSIHPFLRMALFISPSFAEKLLAILKK